MPRDLDYYMYFGPGAERARVEGTLWTPEDARGAAWQTGDLNPFDRDDKETWCQCLAPLFIAFGVVVAFVAFVAFAPVIATIHPEWTPEGVLGSLLFGILGTLVFTIYVFIPCGCFRSHWV